MDKIIILNTIPNEIESLLNVLESKGTINIKAINSGEHSTIYKLSDNLCLKLFKYGTDVEWKNEFKALSQLKNKPYIPKLFAYSENKFLLIEWIEGYNLFQYVQSFGEFPNNFIKTYFDIKIDLIESGFSEWDFKLDEHLIWLKGDQNIVKKIDYGVCESLEREDLKMVFASREKEQYNEVLNKNPKAIDEFEQKLFRCGFSKSQVEKIL